MTARGDWAQGAAKWAAVGLLGTASIGGVAWHLMTRPQPLTPQPAPIASIEPAIIPAPILIRPTLSAPPAPAEHGLIRIGVGPLPPDPYLSRAVVLATRPAATLPGPDVTAPVKIDSPSPSRVDPVPGRPPAPGVVRREPSAAPQRAAPPTPSPPASTPGTTPQRAAEAPVRRLNLNTATQAELELLPGIGPALAKRILDHRAARGPFRTVDELDNVPGIGPATMNRLRPLVSVEGAPR